MGKSTGLYPRVWVDTAGSRWVSHAGGVVLTETIRTLGLDRSLSAALGRWRRPLAVHDPAKVLLGSGCHACPGRGLPGRHRRAARRSRAVRPLASDPTVSRVIDTLAADSQRALNAIDQVRAQTRRSSRNGPDSSRQSTGSTPTGR